MFKRMLFVFVLAAAVLAFAGYSVPTAAACSGSVTSCNTMFGQGFETTVTVPSSIAPTGSDEKTNFTTTLGNHMLKNEPNDITPSTQEPVELVAVPDF